MSSENSLRRFLWFDGSFFIFLYIFSIFVLMLIIDSQVFDIF